MYSEFREAYLMGSKYRSRLEKAALSLGNNWLDHSALLHGSDLEIFLKLERYNRVLSAVVTDAAAEINADTTIYEIEEVLALWRVCLKVFAELERSILGRMNQLYDAYTYAYTHPFTDGKLAREKPQQLSIAPIACTFKEPVVWLLVYKPEVLIALQEYELCDRYMAPTEPVFIYDDFPANLGELPTPSIDNCIPEGAASMETIMLGQYALAETIRNMHQSNARRITDLTGKHGSGMLAYLKAHHHKPNLQNVNFGGRRLRAALLEWAANKGHMDDPSRVGVRVSQRIALTKLTPVVRVAYSKLETFKEVVYNVTDVSNAWRVLNTPHKYVVSKTKPTTPSRS